MRVRSVKTARESSVSDPPRRAPLAGRTAWTATAVVADLGPDLPGYGCPGSLVRILGRSPLQRHLFHFAKLGLERCVIVLNGRDGAAVEGECRRQMAEVPLGGMEVLFRRSDEPVLNGRLEGGCIVAVRGSAVYDPRLYRRVVKRGAPANVVRRCEDGAAARNGRLRPIGLAKLDIGALLTGRAPELSGAEVAAALDRVELRDDGIVMLEELPTYVPGLRRHLRPYACEVRDASDLERACHLILDSAQKGVLDFPARFLHPRAENLLTRWLARTRVTPNQVTIFSGLVGFAAAFLFAVGSFGWGLAVAFVANVLDGVDGKLARVKLAASRFGDRLDHILDVSFEFSWYLALGWGLARVTGAQLPLRIGVGLIGVMSACRAVSGVYKLLTGRQIHDHRGFDRAFRLVAGRRNVYVVMLVAGLLAGRLEEAFYLSFGWGVVTLGVYVARTLMALAGRIGGGGSRPERRLVLAGIEDRPGRFGRIA